MFVRINGLNVHGSVYIESASNLIVSIIKVIKLSLQCSCNSLDIESKRFKNFDGVVAQVPK